MSLGISFEDGGGGGDGWFDLCKNVFSQTSDDRIFYHTACSIIHYEKYLFLVNDFFGDKVFPGITHITPPPLPQKSHGRPSRLSLFIVTKRDSGLRVM